MAKCCIHGCKQTENLYPICKSGTKVYYDEDDLTGKYICEEHLKESTFCNTYEDGGYAKCSLCDGVAYNIRDLTNIGGTWYCKEHKSEAPTDKELDDYGSLSDD
ncbi:hypothetical protein [Clostridium tyrobutyricum]|uniref:hypothetical protein n=1 Tax=Clostridium tyrobutyricum TaxID=1519 RepID=UPI001C395619|nr:hypothetical protein [Clostridium tyrobutyricum]MBV4416974.1 hypothetical protein [Clostridium tyrobutyricum]